MFKPKLTELISRCNHGRNDAHMEFAPPSGAPSGKLGIHICSQVEGRNLHHTLVSEAQAYPQSHSVGLNQNCQTTQWIF